MRESQEMAWVKWRLTEVSSIDNVSATLNVNDRAEMQSTVVSDNNSSNHGQLREFVLLTTRAFTIAASFSYSFVSNATRWSFPPFILVYHAISSLLAPLLVFGLMIIHVFILAPLNVTRYVLSSLYPIYIFCVVACITGIVVGMGGRGLSALLIRALATAEQGRSAAMNVPAKSGGARRSRRRRLRVREEES
jgi:hypothetical protein